MVDTLDDDDTPQPNEQIENDAPPTSGSGIEDGARVFGGPGSDQIDVVGDLTFITGGGGDDMITLDEEVYQTTVQSGSGDDTISAPEAIDSRFFEGSGDDVLSLDYSNTGSEPNFASGGDGFDVIEIDAISSGEEFALPGRVSGGADGGGGDDRLLVEIGAGPQEDGVGTLLALSFTRPDGEEQTALVRLVGITGFDPAELGNIIRL